MTDGEHVAEHRRPSPQPRRRWPRPAQIRKALAALTGAAATAASAGLLPDPAAGYVSGVLAVATALVTYYVQNED